MFKQGSRVKHVFVGIHGLIVDRIASCRCISFSNQMDIKRVLVVSKMSRYEFERYKNKDLTQTELHDMIKNRGSDLDKLLHYHELHKRFENRVVNAFRDLGIQVEVANKINYTRNKVNWADVIVPIGGDGTFLLAASKVLDNTKPVIGFNSDPTRSEGFLCLPKKYSENVDEAVKRLKTGNFDWLMRNRIRSIFHHGVEIEPQHLFETNKECESLMEFRDDILHAKTTQGTVAPVLALNEVFLGETVSARASHLEIALDNGEATGIKCSGLCVSTGTGSSSWHLSMNRLSVQTVAEIFDILKLEPKNDGSDENTAAVVAKEFNSRLIFSATSDKMAYTVRDCITAGVWPNPKGLKDRGYVKEITVKSMCYDGYMVVDGSVCFPFKDGATVTLRIDANDALKTVTFVD